MIYQPSKKETQQIKKLNEGYALIRQGIKMIMTNAPKNDGDISVFAYRANKNIDKIIKRTAVLLEAQYVNDEFIDIVNHFKVSKKKKKKDK